MWQVKIPVALSLVSVSLGIQAHDYRQCFLITAPQCIFSFFFHFILIKAYSKSCIFHDGVFPKYLIKRKKMVRPCLFFVP